MQLWTAAHLLLEYCEMFGKVRSKRFEVFGNAPGEHALPVLGHLLDQRAGEI